MGNHSRRLKALLAEIGELQENREVRSTSRFSERLQINQEQRTWRKLKPYFDTFNDSDLDAITAGDRHGRELYKALIVALRLAYTPAQFENAIHPEQAAQKAAQRETEEAAKHERRKNHFLKEIEEGRGQPYYYEYLRKRHGVDLEPPKAARVVEMQAKAQVYRNANDREWGEPQPLSPPERRAWLQKRAKLRDRENEEVFRRVTQGQAEPQTETGTSVKVQFTGWLASGSFSIMTVDGLRSPSKGEVLEIPSSVWANINNKDNPYCRCWRRVK